METKQMSDSLTEELGIPIARATDLLIRVANGFAKFETHSEMLKDLVCDHDISTSELVFCSFSVGALKENPKMIMDLLLIETARKFGLGKDFDIFRK